MDEAPQPPGRILLTGAHGFVGATLTSALRAAWPDATVLMPDIDVRDASAVAAAMRDARPDSCVHLAAIASIPAAREAPDIAWQVNLHGSLHVAHAILAHAPACQLLFASTADAYGESFRSGIALDETAPLAPMNEYGATKAAADLALGSLAARGLRVVRVRPFNHIGAGQTPAYAVASFARQVARIAAGLQPPLLDVGNLDSFRDFLDVRDVCAAYVACIDRRDTLAPGTILNLASGQARRIGDVLQDLQRMAGVVATLRPNPSRMRASDIPRALGNADRARALLGWVPAIPWPDTLRAVLEDWRARVAEGPDGTAPHVA